jgi:hypothetical protein
VKEGCGTLTYSVEIASLSNQITNNRLKQDSALVYEERIKQNAS